MFAGAVYGQGVYFSIDASYSQDYTNSADVEHCMYLARVLVGNFCQGSSGLIAPPPLNHRRPEILYDSTVDKPVRPTVFVAFADDQVYPEYLIAFRY